MKRHKLVIMVVLVMCGAWCLSTEVCAYDLHVGGGYIDSGVYFAPEGNVVTDDPCIVLAGHAVTFMATGEVILGDGFEARYGSEFTARRTDDVDSDADGLPDWWEIVFFNSLNQGPDDDPDGDGLINLYEYQLTLDPTHYDMSYLYPEGPLAQGVYYTVGDIITEGTCRVLATGHATFAATGEITLTEGFWAFEGSTFWAVIVEATDTDGDGIPDTWEKIYFGDLNQDGGGDYDGDNITNLEEYQLGADPTMNDPDTDDDGLADRWELDHFGSLSQDGAGDYDGDGFSNYYEQEAGTDPTDPNDNPSTTFTYEYDEHGNLIRTQRTEE